MAAQVCAVLLLLSGSVLPELQPGPGPDSARGRAELWRVRSLAAQSGYGGCWARAVEHLDTRCRDMTSESQSRMALSFTFCHLSRQGFPIMPRGVRGQQVQQDILNNGEELRVTLRDSTQGLRAVFSELSSVSREQQVALSELFNRVSFLQSFLLMEAHSLSSSCYNAAALCTSFLLTSTQRSSRARLVLMSLVCVNFYLERRIYQLVLSSDRPEHTHMRRPERRIRAELRRGKEEDEDEDEMCSMLVPDPSHLSHVGWSTETILYSTAGDITLQQYNTHNASLERPSPAPLVYSIQVEDRQANAKQPSTSLAPTITTALLPPDRILQLVFTNPRNRPLSTDSIDSMRDSIMSLYHSLITGCREYPIIPFKGYFSTRLAFKAFTKQEQRENNTPGPRHVQQGVLLICGLYRKG
ncbi:hypothetical protein EYF80_002003 [Liparis tanakae]|uniref:Uncharacterized protein n=1 Tax=Liparis tanakae TaxID=230148 RepID=A0A4Z2JBS5_9TELE|nr:hypothetical protein EYF80_002003 [Liparis tanakae]